MEITQATSPEEIETTRELFREYSEWLAVDLCFQNFEKELAELPGKYAPPEGRLLLAHHEDQLAGCVALRSLGDGICEMKRLYVRPSYRGTGLGRVLLDWIVDEAKLIGYAKMRLDTMPGKMDRAIEMYRRLGFREIGPYYDNPHSTAMYMELELGGGEKG
jgi:putative acetyltransferase